MSKENLLAGFRDITEARRVNGDAFSFMMKHWNLQPAYRVQNYIAPPEIKSQALVSRRLNLVLDQLAVTLKKTRAEVDKEVVAILDEIGLERKMFVVRSAGVFTTKMLCKMCNGVFVNERRFFALKSTMGLNPVVFVPTHRSYADFILMTYLCYCYDIELPAVAAGMDFHSMVGVGRMMRDICAFYIRRTFATDKLYSAVFREYVRTLVTKYHAPLSFFIEGTRSRSGKSLPPKYGFMTMILAAFFAREVPDVTFVPVSFSYNRVMEERLFAYELLGVPKPKESTSAFLKALSIMHEDFGDIYINVGESISAKDYFRDSHDRNSHAIEPVDLIALSPRENDMIQSLSHEIVCRQQSILIANTFQIVAVAIASSICESRPLHLDNLHEEIISLANTIRSYGGNTFDYARDNVRTEVKAVLSSHRNLVHVNQESQVKLVSTTPFIMTEEIKQRMKGHKLSEKTMSNVIPVVMLQLYVNPVLAHLISPSVICLCLLKTPLSKDDLWNNYRHLRILFKYEFPMNERTLRDAFDSCIEISSNNNLIELNQSESKYQLGDNKKLQDLFSMILWPFFSCLRETISVLSKHDFAPEKESITKVQERLESELLTKGATHPYSLSLDLISNCIQGIAAEGSIKKERRGNNVIYHNDFKRLSVLSSQMDDFKEGFSFNYEMNNPVISSNNGISSKL